MQCMQYNAMLVFCIRNPCFKQSDRDMDFCILYAKIIKIKKNKRLEIIQLMCNEARIYDFLFFFTELRKIMNFSTIF